MLTHRNVTWTAHCLVRLFGVGPQEEVISFLPLAHIAERMLSVYIATAAGYCVNFVESPETVAQNMAEVSPTFMFSVPRIWEKYQSTIFIRMKDATLAKRLAFGAALWIGRRYAAAKLANEGRAPLHLRTLFLIAHVSVLAKLRQRLGLDRLRQAVSGAAAISPDVLRFYHAIGVPLRQLYGQTEDTGPTTVHRGDVIDPSNAGPPISGWRSASPTTARSWCAAPTSSRAITRTRRPPPRPWRTAGCIPATWARSTTAASSGSPTARRT